jgi:hypothetical protein
MQKGRGKKLGQQQTEKSIDVGTKNKSWARPEALVQGRLEGCPIREALRKTSGRKARNALLQTIKACKLKDSCNCWRDDEEPEKFKNFTKEKFGATSR